MDAEGRTEIAARAEQWGYLITDARRTGPVEDLGDGMYLFPMEMVDDGATVAGDVVTVQDGKFVRHVWAEGRPRPQAGNSS